MTETRITEALDRPDIEACYAIRIEVFCDEQGVSRDLEFDGLDAECRHYIARIGNDAVGTARLRPLDGGKLKFERVAVRASYRNRKIGRSLMGRALTDAARSGGKTGILHAQSEAAAFYLKLGFIQEGGTFDEAGIPHVRMTKELA
jgi:predicted GNAT family N-acyltransferase